MTEPQYKVVTYHTKKIFEDFVRFSYKVQHPGSGFRIFMFGVCFVTLGFFLSGLRQYLAFSIGLMATIFSIIRHKMAASNLAKTSSNFKENKPVIFEFYSENFSVKNIDEDQEISYKKINPAYEDSNYFYLGINNEVMHLVPKRDFQTGNTEDFKQFLEKNWDVKLETPKKSFKQRYQENLTKAQATKRNK